MPFSQRQLVECLRIGAERFGWSKRNSRPAQVREGRWLIGLGVAAAFRDNLVMKSAARVRLDNRGVVTVETDMTDIGTGSYTVIAQTVAEMMGVPLKRGGKARRLDVPRFLRIWWAMGRQQRKRRVYAACAKLREAVARKHALHPAMRFSLTARLTKALCKRRLQDFSVPPIIEQAA